MSILVMCRFGMEPAREDSQPSINPPACLVSGEIVSSIRSHNPLSTRGAISRRGSHQPGLPDPVFVRSLARSDVDADYLSYRNSQTRGDHSDKRSRQQTSGWVGPDRDHEIVSPGGDSRIV